MTGIKIFMIQNNEFQKRMYFLQGSKEVQELLRKDGGKGGVSVIMININTNYNGVQIIDCSNSVGGVNVFGKIIRFIISVIRFC